MTATVTALLVSHDGARWLPAVLDGLTAQTRQPDRVVAIDTGSTDASASLLTDRLGAESVLSAPTRTPYGEAVASALGAVPAADGDWVWLLHDDSAPDPQALEQLLAAAEANPTVDVLGPKLREWPSLRRLLEVGVTVSGTGRRETGLERGEYDQGQHDRVRDVLAVNTAGMLVRRSVLEQLGFDRRLPIFGNDLDFGWRAARAGHRTIVVPDAVVFHVEAAHRGVRRTELTGRHFRRSERQAALYTLLVNGSARSLPFRGVRLLLGSLLRVLGFLLVRSPGEAADELAAVAAVYGQPWRVWSGRRHRRRTATVSHGEVRHLLAPVWLPYRHGLDFVSDVAAAVAHQASDLSAARRSRSLGAMDTGPVDPEAQNLPEDTGLVARLVTNPVIGVFVLLVVLAFVAARGMLGTGALAGGALLPAPASAAHWWSTYLATGHDLGTGSSAPAAPYLLPLALLGTLLLGKAWLVIDVLFLLAVPLAAFGGYRFLLRLSDSRSAALWGGLAYGLLPVLTGVVQEGRLGTLVVALVLPWLAHAALFLVPGEAADRRWRAAWRAALFLAVMAAFAPLTLLISALLVVLVLGSGLAIAPAIWRPRASWLPLVTPVLMTLVLLLPWSIAVWSHQGAGAFLVEAGLAAPVLHDPVTWLDLVVGRPGSAGAPWWLGLGVVLAAVGSLARRDTRPRVLGAWLVVVLALGTASLLSGTVVTLDTTEQAHPVWLGVPVLLAQAAAICAAVIAGSGIRDQLSGSAFGWRQPVGALVVVVALLAPVAGLAWWGLDGSDDPLERRPGSSVPPYMADAAAADPLSGVLVLRGDRTSGFSHVVVRGPGLRTGDDSVLPRAEQQEPLTDLVARLVTAPQPQDIAELAKFGVGFVYAPRPVDGQLAGNLDTVSGIAPASAGAGARAWQLQVDGSDAALEPVESSLRPWLLGVQALAILVALVLAAPTRKVTR